MRFKLVVPMQNGDKLWINLENILTMTKTAEGQYYITLINGDKYSIDHKTASRVENYFEKGERD